jgi:hypothetical protein
LRYISTLGSTTKKLTPVVEPVLGSTKSSHDTLVTATNTVHVSIASLDADPASIQVNTFRGSPIVMFHDDDVMLLLVSVSSVHMPYSSLLIPSMPIATSVVYAHRESSSIQLVDLMSQLLSGFEALLARQDQSRIASPL